VSGGVRRPGGVLSGVAMREPEWLLADSLYGLDVAGLPGLTQRRFFLFLSAFLPRALWGPQCGVCGEAVHLLGAAGDGDPTLPGWFNFVRAGHPPECASAEVLRTARLWMRGLAGRTELWDAVLDAYARAGARAGRVLAWDLHDPASAAHAVAVKEIWEPGLRMLRDILGNPFRPPAFDPRWRTEDSRGLARGVYKDRAFDRLPLLADALMDAGCDQEDILAHCRSDVPHVRGCWVVDLILGRE
jgi:hypothetical protein